MTWDEHATDWDDNEAVRAYSRAAFGCLQRLQDVGRFDVDGARILDFGCGTGLLTERLARRAEWIVAVDTSAAMIEILSAKLARLGLSNVEAIAGSVESAQRDRPSIFGVPFDLVVCSSVCAFLEDYPGTVAMLVGLLRRGGWFVQWDWELNTEDSEPFGLTRRQVTNTLVEAGLEQVQVDTAFEVEAEGQMMRPIMGFGRTPVSH